MNPQSLELLQRADDKSIDLLLARIPHRWSAQWQDREICSEADDFLSLCSKKVHRWFILAVPPLEFDVWQHHSMRHNLRYIRAGVWLHTESYLAANGAHHIIPPSGFDVLYIGYGTANRSIWYGGGKAGTWLAPDTQDGVLSPMLIESCIDAFTQIGERVAVCDGSDVEAVADIIHRSRRVDIDTIVENAISAATRKKSVLIDMFAEQSE